MAPPRSLKKGKGKAPDPAESSTAPSPAAILQDYIPEPIATLTLDFQNLAGNYKGCIEKIIKAMKDDDSSPNFSFVDKDDKEIVCIPVTPSPDNTASGVYTIALEDGGGTRLLLVAQKYQNWFRGIVTDSGGKYEIDGFKPKIMAGSESLQNTARYYDLIGKTVGECKIGFNPLINSFYNLAGHSAANDKHEVAIAVILVMLFEAPRFPAVFKRCLELLESTDEDIVGGLLEDLINDWATTSLKFFEANGEEGKVVLTDLTTDPIQRAQKVATCMTLLCGSMLGDYRKTNSKSEPKSSAGKWQRKPQKDAA